MPKIKKTPWQSRNVKFSSILGEYMPMIGIKNKSDLSKRAGFGKTSIYAWEKDIGKISLSKFIRLMEVLKVPPYKWVEVLK